MPALKHSILKESNRLGDVLKYEAPNLYSRDEIIVAKGQNLKLGTVVGKLTKDIVKAIPGQSNKGNGILQNITTGPASERGIYTLTCIVVKDSSSKETIFNLTSSAGNLLQDVIADKAYKQSHLGFTLNEGKTPFALGDTFSIVVAGHNKIVALNPTATDGSNKAYGVLFDDTDATGTSAADERAVIIAREAVVSDHSLIWPQKITPDQLSVATHQLESRGIIIRKGA